MILPRDKAKELGNFDVRHNVAAQSGRTTSAKDAT